MSIIFNNIHYLYILVFIILIVQFNIRNKKLKDSPEEEKAAPKSDWRLPFFLAIFISAIVNGAISLFFLAITWVMRLDPKTDSKEILFPSDKDRKRAKGTYTWLLISAVPNILIFAFAVFNLSSRSTANERVFAALTPLIIHLPVLSCLDSNSPFVYRHTQQAIFLLALRASTAALALNISKYPADGIGLFLLANGFLWLFGSFWGRTQANKGKGWWIQRKGETVLGKDSLNMPAGNVEGMQHSPEKSIDYGKWYLKNNNKEAAQQHALMAFRNGNKEIRGQALQLLNELGEVEKF